MNQELLAEEQMENSHFINHYVETHQEELDALRAAATAKEFKGAWVIIGDDGYMQKRYQYATTSFPEEDVSPRIIVTPSGTSDADTVEDIQKAIALCNELTMTIAIRTGGHQYCGYSSTTPENLQLDLSESFTEYTYDADGNTLRCGVNQGLAAWAEANHNNGFYLPMGVCSGVHLGGHVHTGGWGMVARSHGILADHVDAFEIILASGEHKRVVRPVAGVSDPLNDDLYYAVLGGSKGGDFGLVTHFEFTPIRDEHHPNSACYALVWLWSKEKMEAIVRTLGEISTQCANGTIPTDYEFMLTITGFGKMDVFSDPMKDGLRELGIVGKGSQESLSDAVKDELRALGSRVEQDLDILPEAVRRGFEELGESVEDKLDMLPEHVKDDLRELNLLQDGVPVPPLIFMWMCYTDEDGGATDFDDQWFESFVEAAGEPLPSPLSQRRRNCPISEGLADLFIMKWPREMEYPFVKRSRVTNGLPPGFPQLFTERMYEIMGPLGTRDGQHLVSQQQIYAGGAVATNDPDGLTSYSWRGQSQAMSHDSFYSKTFFHPNARATAEAWQSENDAAFIGNGGYADADMRMFAYTFGDNRDLESQWQYFYDSRAKYDRLKEIKRTVDPTGLFSGSFSIPLS